MSWLARHSGLWHQYAVTGGTPDKKDARLNLGAQYFSPLGETIVKTVE